MSAPQAEHEWAKMVVERFHSADGNVVSQVILVPFLNKMGMLAIFVDKKKYT